MQRAINQVWLIKDLEAMSYKKLKGIMDEWNYIDVCPPVTRPRGAPEPDNVSRSLQMMNWLLGRPTEIPQALVDEQSEYKKYGHGARMCHTNYVDYYYGMVEARSSWQEQAEREKKRKWIASAAKLIPKTVNTYFIHTSA